MHMTTTLPKIGASVTKRTTSRRLLTFGSCRYTSAPSDPSVGGLMGSASAFILDNKSFHPEVSSSCGPRVDLANSSSNSSISCHPLAV